MAQRLLPCVALNETLIRKVNRPVRVAVCRGQETRCSVQDLPEGAKLVLG